MDHMTSMAHHINEMKRKHEHAVRVQEIQSQLEDYDGEDLTRLGELVLEVRLIFITFSCSMDHERFLSLYCSLWQCGEGNIKILDLFLSVHSVIHLSLL